LSVCGEFPRRAASLSNRIRVARSECLISRSRTLLPVRTFVTSGLGGSAALWRSLGGGKGGRLSGIIIHDDAGVRSGVVHGVWGKTLLPGSACCFRDTGKNYAVSCMNSKRVRSPSSGQGWWDPNHV